MYRIVIVDDEPLILAGVSSLITWEDYDCTIIGKATNGPTAFDMIVELKPDIVITDIRMPVLSGLDLVEKCKNAGCTFSFIVLTNLEEFHLVKKALSLGASDYLVKIDLTAEALLQSLERAKEACQLLVRQEQHQLLHDLLKDSEEMADKNYFTNLLLLSKKQEEMPDKLEAEYKNPFVILFAVRPVNITVDTVEETYDFHHITKQLIDIAGGIAARMFQCQTLLEYRQDTFLLVASLDDKSTFEKTVTEFCSKAQAALKTYFELTGVFGVSTIQDQIPLLTSALTEAKEALEYYYFDSESPVVFYHGQEIHLSSAKDFNINIFKKELASSVSQNDSEKLNSIFEQIIDLFKENKPGKEQASSACINIYTFLYSFFENPDNTYRDIFPYTINIADQLNQFNSLADILTWLDSFCKKLCRLLDDRKSTRSDKLVEQTKTYVKKHYSEKLTLTDISDVLNISAGHLSNTFKKMTGVTISDYIASVKIDHAKELIDTHEFLMYEISEQLGFDNPYYFSKVFKKVTGISPREYENRTTGFYSHDNH